MQQQQQHVPATRPRPGSFTAAPTNSLLQNSQSIGSIAPPPAVPPRRHSETRELKTTRDEPDLISFVGQPAPVAADDPANDSHASFQRMVSELHKMNAHLQQIPHTKQPQPYGFSQQVMPGQGVSGMQLVPYQQTTPTAAPATVPLTPEQLKKLYSMNYALQPHPNHLQQHASQPLNNFNAAPSYNFGRPSPPANAANIQIPFGSAAGGAYIPTPSNMYSPSMGPYGPQYGAAMVTQPAITQPPILQHQPASGPEQLSIVPTVISYYILYLNGIK